MKKKIFACSVLVLCLAAGCNFQDSKYLHPCAGKYGSENVIKKIRDRYKLREDAIIVFNEGYKEPAQLPTNCDTIHLYIDFDSTQLLSEDTFAVSVGYFFFNDTSNSDIKVLNLTTKSRWPAIGEMNTTFILSKETVQSYKYESTLFNSNSGNGQQYQIIEKTFTGGPDDQGLSIIANVENDVIDFQNLANTIKADYAKVIKDKRLSNFFVELRIKSPFCRLCLSKTYFLFFSKKNRNI